ncbi:MAG TPA: bifunctional phosphopantothenoylcysteine decarboxylase/phosphopantothenate--cysteine ligase CoaBC, partial [Candidatus Elarobacter sp.]|nr:bifunctional phosphopantothenoylcysteine decarboxylase/phosphopantothenate--cysteine ligase CoaBC [Candidatus Elarobacter sp.]
GYRVIDPDTGPLAVGEGEGPGRLPEPEAIALHVARALAKPSPLAGRTVVVSAGATREPLDPVRFISNHSTGRMGVAIARAAWLRGANVTLVEGATEVEPPHGVAVTHVGTTQEMATAIERLVPSSDVLIMAAAPADFRPARVALGKIKKWNAPRELQLAETPDILVSSIPYRRAGMIVVGFALETENLVQHARVKLQHKQLDLVVANRAGAEGEGFGSDTNRVTFVTASASEELPMLSKDDVADAILDRVENLLDGR